jgi:transposase-like protein
MGTIMPIPADIKARVLEDIQKNGLSVMNASQKHGMNYKTVHGWLKSKSLGSTVSWHEHHRLKAENQRLKEIIGELTLHQSRIKKM